MSRRTHGTKPAMVQRRRRAVGAGARIKNTIKRVLMSHATTASKTHSLSLSIELPWCDRDEDKKEWRQDWSSARLTETNRVVRLMTSSTQNTRVDDVQIQAPVEKKVSAPLFSVAMLHVRVLTLPQCHVVWLLLYVVGQSRSRSSCTQTNARTKRSSTRPWRHECQDASGWLHGDFHGK